MAEWYLCPIHGWIHTKHVIAVSTWKDAEHTKTEVLLFCPAEDENDQDEVGCTEVIGVE